MSLATTPEQAALAASVRGVIDRHGEQAWPHLRTEIGVAGLLVPERFGGLGASLADAAVVLEELGRELTPSAMLGTVVAVSALLATGDEEACARLLPAVAAGSSTLALVLPGAAFVLDGIAAETFLVADGGMLVEVAAADVVRAPVPGFDESRSFASVRCDGVTGGCLGPFDQAAVEAVACAALSAEQVGAAARALDRTVAYSLQRVQFGRPIGAFQALAHRMADLHVLVESATSLAWAAVQEPADATLAAAAKVHCSEAFTTVAGEMIQLHGGIAITWEHDAHRYLRRAYTDARLFGDPDGHVARVWAAM
ncbi:MAG: acyl-CoA dehydrogenase [Hamadaea sp.]|nr:acyl-CoA dehydrogenase [Hamadaea sp.]